MNFLKSGTIDEAPLMLVFILAGLYALGNYIRYQDRSGLIILSGILLGLSTMTRYTTLVAAFGVALYLITGGVLREKMYKKILLFVVSYLSVLSSWLFRSYLIYGKPVLCAGDSRILVFTQSKEFIHHFPIKSPDAIEHGFMRSFYDSDTYLTDLDELSHDKEFRRYAIAKLLRSPGKYIHSLFVKLKVVLALRYYPKADKPKRNIVFVISYLFTLTILLFALIMRKKFMFENRTLLISIIGLLIPGILYFMTSRHPVSFNSEKLSYGNIASNMLQSIRPSGNL